MVFSLKKEVRDINRFRQIVLVLFEEGFGYLLGRIRLMREVPVKNRVKAKLAKEKRITLPVRLRLTLEKLGPTFIKLGQLLSVRPDLVPKDYIKELEKLQDKVGEFSFDIAEKEIKKELGGDIKDIFSAFNKKPIASASVSQVYEARLKSGEKVAVKIQRPNVKEIMGTDTDIMFYIARLIEKYMPESRKYSPVKIVNEFAEWTKDELNFKIEARNAKIFYQNFKGSKIVHIPKMHSEYTRETVLVMEFIDGVELHNVKKIREKGLNFDSVIKNGFDVALTSVFIHGFFHADPHPGNILVMKGNKIGLVDFGIVGHFDEDLKRKSINLFRGIVEENVDKVVETFLEMGAAKETIDIGKFKSEVRDIIESLQDTSLKNVKLSSVLEDVLDTALEYGIKMPTDFVLFGKALVTLEGIALEYDPGFRLVNSTKPFINKLIRKKYDPRSIINSFIDSSTKLKQFITELPEQTTMALKKIQSGTVKIDIEDADVKRLSLEIDKSSNRLAYGMIIAALLVAGALVMQVGEPVFLGMPLVSFICFLVAVMISIALFSSIFKERLLK